MRALAQLLLVLQLVAAPNALAAYSDPAEFRSAEAIPAGTIDTWLEPPRVKGPVLADGTLTINVTVERVGAPMPTGAELVTITAPFGFVIEDATAEPTFQRLKLRQWDEFSGPTGQWYAQFVGVRSPEGPDTFTLVLSANRTFLDGFYAFDVQVCENALFCATGEATTPALEVDGIPPDFRGFGALPLPAWPGTDFTSGVANLTWTITDPANVSGYYLSESPLPADATWTSGALPTSFTLAATGGDGTRTIYASVRDALGNVANRSATIPLDVTSPKLDAPSVTPPANANGWWNAKPSVSATASDGQGSGVKDITIEVSPGPDMPIPEGEHVVYVNATDLVGRADKTTLTINVDTTDPVVTDAKVLPELGEGWHASFPTAWVNATDALSGLATTRYRLVVDAVAGEWSNFTPGEAIPLGVNAASVALEYEIVDLAGNSVGDVLPAVAIDTIAPDAPTLDVIGPILSSNTTTLSWSAYASAGDSPFAAWHVKNNGTIFASIADEAETSLPLAELPHGSSYSFSVVAQSAAGLPSESEPLDVLVDLNAPDVTHLFTPSFKNGTWYTGPDVALTLTLAEDVTNVSNESVYRIGDATFPFAAGETVIPLTDAASILVGWNASDTTGHWVDVTLPAFGVDTTAPLLGVPDVWAAVGSGGFYAPPVLVNFSAEEPTSGIALVEHSFDGENWTEGATVEVDETGTIELRFRATNGAGLVNETVVALDVALLDADATLPNLTRSLAAIGGNVVAGASPAQVVVAIDGAESRVNVTGPTWNLTLPSPLADGEHTIEVHVEDEAGRASAPKSYLVHVDGTAPALTITLPSATNLTSANLGVASSEALLGPATVERALGAGWSSLGTVEVPGTFALALPSDGTFTIRVSGVDAAGNPTNASAVITRDTTVPQVLRVSPARVLLAENTTLAFTAIDGSPLVKSLVVHRDDGATFEAAADSVFVPLLNTTRELVYLFEATDVGLNTGRASGVVRVVDPTAPTVLVALEGVAGNAGWYRSNVTALLTVDPIGSTILAASHLEGQQEQPLAPTTQLALAGTGRHVVEHQATLVRDGVLLESTIDTLVVPIDLAPPTVSLLSPPDVVPESARFSINATASDVGSGLAGVSVLVERNGALRVHALTATSNGTWTGLLGPYVFGDDVSIAIRAVDVAGYTTVSPSHAIALGDATPPLVVLDAPGARASGIVTLSANASDASGIASLTFEVDGDPHAPTWDTRLVANGLHNVSANALDNSGNPSTDRRAVLVDNPPVVGALAFSPNDDSLPTPATELVTLTLAASAYGRTPTVEIFQRAGSGAFTALPVTSECDESACVFRANVPTPYVAGATLEAYAIARDGPSSVRVPASGVVSVAVKLPAASPLASWIDGAQANLTEGEEDIPEAHLDIVQAGVLRSHGITTFAARMRGNFDAGADARYFVDFLQADATEPFFSYAIRYNGTWESPEGADLVTDASEFRLRVPNEELASDLGGVPADLRVLFRSEPAPSGLSLSTLALVDVTASAALDLTPPQIGGVALVSAVRNQTVAVNVSTSDNGGAVTARVLPTLDGIALPEAAVANGTAQLGVLDGGRLDILVIALDASGNRNQTARSFDLQDTEAPVALAGVLGAKALPEGAFFALSADASRDNAGITSFEWKVGAATVATGHRALVPFLVPGNQTVTLVVRDAANNTASDTVTVEVIDITPPDLALVAPASGSVVRAGVVSFDVAADDATSVGLRIDGGAWLPAAPAEGKWRVTAPLAEGPHAIEIRATDEAGHLAMLLAPATIIADGTPPIVSFTVYGASPGMPSTFIALVSEANGLASIRWTFGDGVELTCTLDCATALHAYPSVGAYTARVVVTDRAGLAGEATVALVVPAPSSSSSSGSGSSGSGGSTDAGSGGSAISSALDLAPKVSVIGPMSAKVGQSVVFTAQPDPRYDGASYAWTFADGTSATGASVAHAWSEPGEYIVILVATSGSQTGTSMLLITIAPAPADPDPTPPAPPPATSTPGSSPAVPVTRVEAPEGLIASPATVRFDAGPGAVVYWRFDDTGWRTTSPAVVGGEGEVTVEFYAVGPGGREATRRLTLDLDGIPPSLSGVTLADGRVSVIARDAHLATVEARIRDASGALVRAVPLALEGETHLASLAGLAPGTYVVELVARDTLGRETVQPAGEYRVSEELLEETSVPGAQRETPAGGWTALVALTLAGLALAGRRGRR